MIDINRKKFLILVSFFLIVLLSLPVTCYAASSYTESSSYVTFNEPLPYVDGYDDYVIFDSRGSYYAYIFDGNSIDCYGMTYASSTTPDTVASVYDLYLCDSGSFPYDDEGNRCFAFDFLVYVYDSDSGVWKNRAFNFYGPVNSIVYSTVDIKSVHCIVSPSSSSSYSYDGSVFF